MENVAEQDERSYDRPPAARLQRLGAALLDMIIILLIEIPLLTMLGVFSKLETGGGVNYEMTLQQRLIFLGLHLAVYAAVNGFLLLREGQTLGKKIVGIRIVGTEGQLCSFTVVFFIRYALFGAVSYIPGIGGLLSLADILFIFGEQRRCIHDYVAGTKVVLA